VTHHVQYLNNTSNILLIQDGGILLQGSFEYMKEQGVDFEHIAHTYDESTSSVKSISSLSEEVNLYDLGDDFNEEEDEYEQDSESFIVPSCKAPVPILKLDNVYGSRLDTPDLNTAETERKESQKTLRSLFKAQSKPLILVFESYLFHFKIHLTN